MSNYSLPLFMQVKENAVSDLNKNLNLYMPKLVVARALILTTEGLLQTLDKKVKILLNQLRGYEVVTVKESSFDFAVEVAKKVAMNNTPVSGNGCPVQCLYNISSFRKVLPHGIPPSHRPPAPPAKHT